MYLFFIKYASFILNQDMLVIQNSLLFHFTM